jgi:hypothetical protein
VLPTAAWLGVMLMMFGAGRTVNPMPLLSTPLA